MGKLVVIKIGSGSFEQGFPVTLQMGEDGASFHTSLDGKLPPFPQIPSLYTTWQSEYRHFLNPPRVEGASLGKKPATKQRASHSVPDVNEKAEDLIKNLNQWLNSETFRPIKDKLQQKLKTDDTVRVIIQTEDSLLRRLPWYLWDLFANYRLAEVALSSPAFERVEKSVQPKAKVRILAILGDRSHPQTGIPINIEADRQFLESLPDAETVFLVEPTRQEFNDKLWDRNGWDILFFAGHSSSQPDATTGEIYINSNESLMIPDLKLALQKAIERGLQLAIFNSCDGLGIAKDLAGLQIPQIIVMREPVPDLVAKEFLKYFLSSFSSGQSLYISVREGRERLHGLENHVPCAFWLPVICQNPAENPVTWRGLRGIKIIQEEGAKIKIASMYPKVDFINTSNDILKNIQIKFYKQTNLYKNMYRKYGNTEEIIKLIEFQISIFELFPELAHTYQAGKLYEFIGYLFVNTESNQITITKARNYLSKAKNIFDAQNFFSEEIINAQIRTTWLIAITYKQELNPNKTYEICYNFLKNIDKVATFENKISLIREIALVEQSKKLFDYLRDNDTKYNFNQMETFYTYRRIFEFYLNNRDLEKAHEILPGLLVIFKAVKLRLDKIYYCLLLKNLYHYYSLAKNTDKASYFFNLVSRKTKELRFEGQHKKILTLKKYLDV